VTLASYKCTYFLHYCICMMFNLSYKRYAKKYSYIWSTFICLRPVGTLPPLPKEEINIMILFQIDPGACPTPPAWIFWTTIEYSCLSQHVQFRIICYHMTKFKVQFVCYLDKLDFKSQSCDLKCQENTWKLPSRLKRNLTSIPEYQK